MKATPALPIPLSLVAGRYLCFSVDAVMYLRREHHICGVLIGSIPLFPQQNVFHGLPLQLMPEEVRLLVEKGVASVVDDTMAHHHGLLEASMPKRRCYAKMLQGMRQQAANSQAGVKDQTRAKARSKSRSKATEKPAIEASARENHKEDDDDTTITGVPCEESLFAPPSPSGPTPSKSALVSTIGITPSTSALLLTQPPSPSLCQAQLPAVPDSYPLFKHLHEKGYFLMPGLTFGCHYMAYPGDPLRFHSHFLASHVGWDEDLDLLDVVGGGRLGTTEKKAYLIGGSENENPDEGDQGAKTVRTFSIEWASM